MIPNLHVGQRLTIFFIDHMLAWTHRQQIEIRSVCEPSEVTDYAGETKTRLGTFRQPRKRKEFYFDLAADVLVFDGWDVPFKPDTEGGGMFSGNACYNLVGDPAVIREWVETKQLNPGVGDQTKATILAWPEKRDNVNAEGTLVYPEIRSSHAVINHMKEKLVPS